jgi:hypothetical protein
MYDLVDNVCENVEKIALLGAGIFIVNSYFVVPVSWAFVYLFIG